MSNNNNECCFTSLVKVIDVLQRNAESKEQIDEGCTKPFLGGCPNVICFNTRPVTFYNCNNTLFTLNYQMMVDGTSVTGTSSIFRIEKVDGCCCTVSILAPNEQSTDPLRPYISTGNFATINLNCVCAIKCLPDVVIDCL